MLRAEDLRIGNYLFVSKGDEPAVARKIDDKDIHEIYYLDPELTYDPIPITKKLLELLAVGEYIRPGLGSYCDIQISYLHELQNLFHAVNKKELVIPATVFTGK